LVQLAVLLTGLAVGAAWLDIKGVAVAVSITAVVGGLLLLRHARLVVDFSFRQIFLPPTIGMAVGIVLGLLVIELPGVLGSAWRTGSAKAIAFTAAFALILILMEREELAGIVAEVRRHLRRQTAPDSSQGQGT
jgi:hypothetical protein